MTSLINGEKKTPNIIEKVINISNKLMKQTSIPQVKGKLHILQQISNVDYWIEIAPVAVDKLREEIRDLIKFLEPENRQIVYTSIHDNIASVNESPAVFETNSFNKEAYKDKLEQFVKENQLDITIDKIRKNIKVTKEDISHLEKMLFSQGTLGSKEVFKEVYGDKPLGEFIRSVVGLDKVEAKNAFAKITNEASFNLKQMEFMNLLIDYFSVNGVIDLKMLTKSPFSDIHSGGIVELFGADTTLKIRDKVMEINNNCLTA